MVSFGNPGLLWLLVVPVLAGLAVLHRHRARRLQQRQLASPAVWHRLMGAPPATGLVRLLLWCLAASLTVVALARPRWGELAQQGPIHTRDLVLALDLSDSMRCPDLRPSRLQRVVAELRQILPRLLGNRVGVVVFAGEAYPLVPLTTDLEAVLAFLDGIEPGMVGLPGSNLEQAVETALDLLPEEGQGRLVVLLSDGESLQGDLAAAATRLEQSGVHLLAVVAGTAAGGPIPIRERDGSLHYKLTDSGQPVVTRARREHLMTLATAGRGRLIELRGAGAGEQLLSAVSHLRARAREMSRPAQLQDRFPLALAVAALLVVAGFAVPPWRRQALAGSVVALLALTLWAPWPVNAGIVADPTPAPTTASAPATLPAAPEPAWWQRLLPGGSRRLAGSGRAAWQRGERALATRCFAVAYKLDPRSGLRAFDLGTALAANGELQAALPLLSEAHRRGAAAAAYNLGTAALLQGDGELARYWLRQALLAEPGAGDVRRNYELALRLQSAQRASTEAQPSGAEDGAQAPAPMPTRQPSAQLPTEAIYAALQRAENQTRAALRSHPARQPVVAKDW